MRLLGKLKYRTSYGQSVLKHSLEVSYIAGLMAAELGADERLARRAGLLHDIGKALDHEMEGSHIALGVEFARKYKESEAVVHAIEAHHGDVECKTVVACLVQAADAVSASRPAPAVRMWRTTLSACNSWRRSLAALRAWSALTPYRPAVRSA